MDSAIASQSTFFQLLSSMVVKAWDVQCNGGVLLSPLERCTHSFVDILRFTLTFARRHRAAGKSVSTTCSDKLDMWRRALVSWFAKLADKAVLALYLNNAVSREQACPALRSNNPNKRQYVVMSPEAKWNILCDARKERTSPSTVLALRSDSNVYGCHEDSADYWMRKEQAMYANRAAIGLASGVGHAIR